MAFQLSFQDSSKEIKLNNLFGLPEIKYNKFIGLTATDFAKIGLNPFTVKNTAFLGPTGAALDFVNKISGYDIGLEGQAGFKKAGLQFDASFDLGSINLKLPWEKAGGLSLQLSGNDLVINSTLKAQLPSININAPSLKLYAGFEVEAEGQLDFNLGNKKYNLVPKQPFKYTYEILNFSSDSELPSDSPEREKSIYDGAFKTKFDFPTFDDLQQILKPRVSSTGIELGGSIPLFTIQSNLIKLIGNSFPIVKLLSGEKDFGGVKVNWELLEASINGGINLDIGAAINFGNPVALLKFEDETFEKINLNSSSITIPNILARLDNNQDGKANIEVQLGFDAPRLRGNAGLSSDIFLQPRIGYASVNVDGLGAKSIGPLYTGKFPIFNLPLPFAQGKFEKDLPASLAPTVRFSTTLPIGELSDSNIITKSLEQIDAPNPILKQIVEKQGDILLARYKDNAFVLYNITQLNPPEATDSINPYLQNDLVNKDLILIDKLNQTIGLDAFYKPTSQLDQYTPIAAEIDESGNYEIIFQDFLASKYYYWQAKEVDINGQKYAQEVFGTQLTRNQAFGYEKRFDQDIVHNGVIDPGELVFIPKQGSAYDRTGLWKVETEEGIRWSAGYSQARLGVYITDPTNPTQSLPGEPVAVIGRQYNYIDPNYEAVIFFNDSQYKLWNINDANERVPRENETLDLFEIGYFEQVTAQDINRDGTTGTKAIIDSDIDTVEYTTLSLVIDNNNPYPGSYVVSNNPFTNQYGVKDEIFIKNKFGRLGPSFGSNDFNHPVGAGWKAIAADMTLNSFGDLAAIDVMWRDPESETRWFIWRFDDNGVAIDSNNNLDDDYKRLSEYLNTADEVSIYEGQFDEDFNQDGFIGKTTITENVGETKIVLVEDPIRYLQTDFENYPDYSSPIVAPANFGPHYEIKELNDSLSTRLSLDTRGIPDVLPSSGWQPIASERIVNEVALAELTQAGKKYNESYKYYYVLGEKSDTSSIWLFSKNPLGSYAVKELERTVAQSDITAYEEVFQQDLNNDGSVNQITQAIDLFGATSLVNSQDGYIIEDQSTKLYLKSSNGTVVTEENFEGLPRGIEKTASGFQMIKSIRGSADFEVVDIDDSGYIQSAKHIYANSIDSYEAYFEQKFNPIVLGSSSNDTLNGSVLDDLIDGGEGNDDLLGNDGNDKLYGQEGQDSLYGGAGNNELFGGIGNDILQAIGNDSLYGGEGNDLLFNGSTISGNLYLNGGAGDDDLFGGAGYDTLIGEAGDDGLYGGKGDNLYGGEGNDILNGQDSTLVDGGFGNDSYFVYNPTDQIVEATNAGIDIAKSYVSFTLKANIENLTLLENPTSPGISAIDGTGNNLDNTITGNAANNNLSGKAGLDTLSGEAGQDTLDGGFDDDTLYGGQGNDLMLGRDGRDAIYGGSSPSSYSTSGNDTLNGGRGADNMYGGDGNDLYIVDHLSDFVDEDSITGGIDTVKSSVSFSMEGIVFDDGIENLNLTGSSAINGTGNSLANKIIGNKGNNILYGAIGNDTLLGRLGNDTILGQLGNDTLIGRAENDSLTGGAGTDRLTGGTGKDIFIFNSKTKEKDVITDLSVVDDTINVSAAGFGGKLTAGAAITAAQFRIGIRAGDSSDRFIYNKANGALLFDADGTGAIAPVQFAQLSTGLALTNNDIFVTA